MAFRWPRRKPPAPGGPIVYVGSPDRRKNLPALLRAYALLREQVPGAPRLVLAGRPPSRGGEVPAMIRRPPWYPHVRHLGYVTDAERQQLYREAAMLVLGRYKDERIQIGNDVEIVVVDITRGRVRLGIRAPGEVLIMRTELLGTPPKGKREGGRSS